MTRPRPEADPAPEPAPSAYDPIVRSHRQVRAFLAAMDAHARGEADADWRGALAALAPLLPQHFAAEEAPEGFCDLVTRFVSPTRSQALRREHREMLRWIDAMGALEGSRLEKAARAFARLLGAHERGEAELALRCERALGR